jgi:hypothetical protein
MGKKGYASIPRALFECIIFLSRASTTQDIFREYIQH